MRFLLFAYIIFLPKFTISQIDKYYAYIQDAEFFILKDSTIKARKTYEIAFTKLSPYAFDLRNYFRLIENLPSSVWKTELIKNKTIIENKFTFPWWKNFIQESKFSKSFKLELLSFSFKFKAPQNTNLCNEITFLANQEQKIRKDCMKNYGNKIYESSTCLKEIKVLDSINERVLVKLYKNNEKINEQTIGEELMNSIYTICLHNTAHLRTELLEVLSKEIVKGNAFNKAVAEISDRYREEMLSERLPTYYGSLRKMIYNKKYLIITKSDSTMIKNGVEMNRSKIFLEDMNDEDEKYTWSILHTKFNFYTHHFMTLPDDRLKKVILNIQNNNKFIVKKIDGINRN